MSRSYFKIKIDKPELFNDSEIIYMIVNNTIDVITVYDKNYNKVITYSEFESDRDPEDYTNEEKEIIKVLDNIIYKDEIYLLLDADEFIKLKETYYGKKYNTQ